MVVSHSNLKTVKTVVNDTAKVETVAKIEANRKISLSSNPNSSRVTALVSNKVAAVHQRIRTNALKQRHSQHHKCRTPKRLNQKFALTVAVTSN